MGLTEEEIRHIMTKTGCDRSNAGAFDYALSDFWKDIPKVQIDKSVKKGGKK
jgi:hypothetical protein